MSNKTAGFTLLETLLSIAIIAAIAGMSMPVYLSFQARNDLDIAVNTVVQSSRRAQALSRASEADATWGLSVQSEKITIFKGSSYDARDLNFDEEFKLPGSITASGDYEVVYNQLTGDPSTPRSIELTSNTNEIRSITINEKGMVDY